MQRWMLGALIACLMWVGSTAAESQSSGSEGCDPWFSKIVSIQGQVEVKHSEHAFWQPARLDDTFCQGDRLRVGLNSRAALLLFNDSVIRLDQGTTIVFQGVEAKQTFLLQLLQGVAHFFSHKARSLKILTPFVNGVVRGTEFLVKVDPDKTRIIMYEGQFLAENGQGSLLLTRGQAATAQAHEQPRLYTVVRPRDAVQWTLYYPPILYMEPTSFEGADAVEWKRKVARSITYFRQDDLSNAYRSIEGLGDGINDARFFLYRAGLRLAVGRTGEAQSDIDHALALNAASGDAWALRAIIAIVQNRKDDALAAAQKAVALNPDSAAARIALSYVYQARFDLVKAREQARIAVEKEADNAIAWARLAELRLSLENLEGALEAARKAAELSPHLSLTQTVLGFAYLTQIKTHKAQDAFARAITLDSAAPLPRLGLGLVQIRQGHLTEGRRQIEIAAGLDPENALIRSYMGKAYFDEKRDALAGRQLAMAKELDPADPTPWFYDAIRKQTENRPVEALQDIQESIRLNDNRAIYRSKLALDSDLATRSASVGRIYRDLGFEQLALVQGWRSLDADPSNYSAHRFLADSYSDLPRHEIARVSELLQSQLLQPLNITPIQPQLAESDLFILEGAGPADPAFNEFNPLFLRNRLALQASAVAGSNKIAGDDIVQSAVFDNFSYSLGQFHYETDGFRDNNDRKADVYDLFSQVRLSPRASVLFEYRDSGSNQGDLPLRFDPENFSPFFRQNKNQQSYRIGGRYAIDRRNNLIGTFVYSNLKAKTNTSIPEFGVEYEVKIDDNSYLAEVQHIFESRRLNLISGLGYFHADEKTIQTLIPGPPETLKNPVEQTTPYIYSQIHLPENLTWTLGASADFYKRLTDDRNQWNPKLGMTWRLSPMTTIRAAVFRTFNRSLIGAQTLEPTQVAGFNQFFDDTNGTSAWRYGAAVDHTLTSGLFGGIEFSRFDLDVPYEDLSNNAHRVNWTEYEGRAYLFWTPNNWISTSISYRYEKFEREKEFVGTEEIKEVETHRIPIGFNFFYSFGLTLRLKGTYIDQKGEFGDPRFGMTEKLSDQFFLVDAAVSYRLPDRFGILSLSVKNLFDQEFKFQDTDPANPEILPELTVISKLTLNF